MTTDTDRLRAALTDRYRIERFVMEIKTTASLRHPDILPLFDSGTADGFLYYVMPFIQGETLRDKRRDPRGKAALESIEGW